MRREERKSCWTGSFQVQESSGSAHCIVLEVNASVRKLLSTIEAHLVSPARNRERTAYVAMPAAKEPLEDGLDSKFHNLLPWQFVLQLRAPCCMRMLALWVFRDRDIWAALFLFDQRLSFTLVAYFRLIATLSSIVQFARRGTPRAASYFGRVGKTCTACLAPSLPGASRRIP